MLNVVSDSGKPVDWWFMYKISKESRTPSGKPVTGVTGGEYAYFDSEMAKQSAAKPVLSPNRVGTNQGALYNTLAPLFTDVTKANKSLGWFSYNDEDHLDPRGKGTGPEDRGHCKGVLAFDLTSNSAFWLIHSVPLLPMTAAYKYPDSGLKMAQTYLCIALADADTSKHIAQLMYDGHGPNVNVASDLLRKGPAQQNGFDPNALPLTDVGKLLGNDDPRVLLMQNLNGSIKPPLKPYSGRVPFSSRGGQKFLAIAKNKAWGNKQDDPGGVKDFYDDLVGVVLNEDIEVETWENAGNKIPPEVENGETHKVENMKSVNLAPLGIPYSWSEDVDHAKLAISDRNNPQDSDRWVCVGDINFTDAQERRGGGTVAFQCVPLWNSLVQVLSAQQEAGGKPTSRPSKPASSAEKPTSNKKPATAKKPVGKKAPVGTRKTAIAAKKSTVVKRKSIPIAKSSKKASGAMRHKAVKPKVKTARTATTRGTQKNKAKGTKKRTT